MKYRDMFSLDGKVAVVVGGCGGLGQAIVEGLATWGADVAVADLDPDRCPELLKRVEDLGRRAMACRMNIVDEDSVRRGVEEIVSHMGRIDILVNAAGTMVWQAAEEYSLENWRRVVDTNLTGVFLTCREVGRVMISQGQGGKIISISSVRGQLGYPRDYTAYCASKGGLNLYTKALAAEWARYRINVNAVAPTFIETPLTSGMLSDPATRQKLLDRIPLHRLGTPSDLVGAIVFLASPASDFITGHVLLVDGGVTCTQ